MSRLEPCPLCGSKAAPTLFAPSVGVEALWQITCDMTRGGCGLTLKRGLRLHVLAAWDIRAIRDEHDLRDRFAGQALAGFCAASDYQSPTAKNIAMDAYEYADAMLAERMKVRP